LGGCGLRLARRRRRISDAIPSRLAYGRQHNAEAASARLDWGDRYCRILVWSLAAFAIAGKGFAYLGKSPLFVTEIVLLIGLVMMIQTRAIIASLLNLPALLLVALMALALYHTVPFVPVHGVDALRDSVLIMYALFAFVVASLVLQKPQRLIEALSFLRWFTGVFVVIGPAIYILNSFPGAFLPNIAPGVPILSVRAGELGVHLCGCALLALVGLRTTSWRWIAALFVAILLVASQNRGGLLAILIPVILVLPFTRMWGKGLMAGFAGIMVLGLAYAVDLEMPSRNAEQHTLGERPLGARQAVDNVLSLVLPAENRQLGDTRAFRLNWWQDIVNYTVHGPLFWTGKGFGVNLAEDDGHVVGSRDVAPLRSPHNSHLNILARTGVPGAALWTAFLGCWLLTIMACARTAWANGDENWGNLLLFIAGYWVSNLVNASFDVALEAPMLGVWFWCQSGLGLAAVATYRAARSLPAVRSI